MDIWRYFWYLKKKKRRDFWPGRGSRWPRGPPGLYSYRGNTANKIAFVTFDRVLQTSAITV